MEIISPSGRTYHWDKPEPPTEEDYRQLVEFEAAQPRAEQAPPAANKEKKEPVNDEIARALARTMAPQMPGFLSEAMLVPILTKGGAGMDVAVEVVPAIAGALLGSGGGPPGIAVGGAAGAAVGNALKQSREMLRGDRQDFGVGELGTAAVLGATPIGKVAPAATITKTIAKTVTARSGQGGAIAGGAELVRQAVDADQFDWTKVAQSTALGFGFGAFMGLGEGLLKSSAIKDAIGDMVKKAASRAGVYFAPSRKVGQEIVEAIHQASGKVEGAKFESATMRAKINDAIKNTEEPAIATERLSKYIYGESNSIPKELLGVKDEIIQFRKSITRFQGEMLENHYSGKRVLSDSMVEQLESAGTQQGWLKRIYQFWGDPNYQPSTAKRVAAIDEMVAGGTTKARAETVLSQWDRDRGHTDALFRAYTSGRDAGILTPRKNLGPALRSYLGEITTPGEVMEGSLNSIAKLAAYDTADREIGSILKRMGLTKKAGEGIEGYVPLSLRRGPVMDGADEVFIPTDVQRALNSLYGSKAQARAENSISDYLADFVKTGISVKKAMLVPLNAVTYATNGITNAVQVLAQGINPFAGGKKAGTVGLASFETVAQNLKTDGRNYVKRMTELGLATPGFTTADMLAGLNKSMFFGRTAAKVLEPAGRAYSVTDTAMRISVYESTKAQMMKEFPSVLNSPNGLDALERAAAQQTNNTYQQYSRISQPLRELSTWGVLGQFVSFNLEMMRNQWNQGSLIKAKLSGTYASEMSARFGVPIESVNQQLIKQDAAKRLASMAGVYAAGIGGVAVYNYGPGGVKDEKELDALKETALPAYLRQKTTLVNKGKDGKISYKNAEYVVPHLATINPVLSAINGESLGDSVRRFGETVARDYGGELPLFLRVLAQAYMDDEITQKTTLAGRIGDRLSFFSEQVIKPQTLKELEKTFGPNPSQTIQTLGKRLLGVRVFETTVEEGAAMNIRLVSTNLRILKEKAGRMEKEGRPGEIEALQKTFEDNQKVLQKHIANLYTLGQDENNIIRILRGSGISGRNAIDAIDGRPSSITGSNLRNSEAVWDEMQADQLLGISKIPDARGLAQLRQAISGEQNLDIRRGLTNRLNRELELRRKDISERDKVVRGLGVENGERAQFIQNQMKGMDNPNAYLNQMRRKGIVTPSVARQIDQLQRAEQSR